jgi:hypothetical protein
MQRLIDLRFEREPAIAPSALPVKAAPPVDCR